MLRRDQLCPGPGDCPDVLMADPFAGASSARCEECPLTLLESYLGTGAGQTLLQTIDLEFALQAGVTIHLEDIGFRDFLLLRFLAEERNRYQGELMRRK
jgi:hypothetical protein